MIFNFTTGTYSKTFPYLYILSNFDSMVLLPRFELGQKAQETLVLSVTLQELLKFLSSVYNFHIYGGNHIWNNPVFLYFYHIQDPPDNVLCDKVDSNKINNLFHLNHDKDNTHNPYFQNVHYNFSYKMVHLPGFEPGQRAQKALVLSVTLQVQKHTAEHAVILISLY